MIRTFLNHAIIMKRRLRYPALAIGIFCWLALASASARGQAVLIPMDETQTDHLKAYGLTYWALQPPRQFKAQWLLNYRGGAFLIQEGAHTSRQADLLGVSYEVLDSAAVDADRHRGPS